MLQLDLRSPERTITINLPLPPDLEARIRQCARLDGITLGLWIVQACYKVAHEEEKIAQSCTWPTPTGAYAPPEKGSEHGS